MMNMATDAAWFSSFLEKASVRRVKRRIDMRIVRWWRSTQLVEMSSGFGLPMIGIFLAPVQAVGL